MTLPYRSTTVPKGRSGNEGRVKKEKKSVSNPTSHPPSQRGAKRESPGWPTVESQSGGEEGEKKSSAIASSTEFKASASFFFCWEGKTEKWKVRTVIAVQWNLERRQSGKVGRVLKYYCPVMQVRQHCTKHAAIELRFMAISEFTILRFLLYYR